MVAEDGNKLEWRMKRNEMHKSSDCIAEQRTLDNCPMAELVTASDCYPFSHLGKPYTSEGREFEPHWGRVLRRVGFLFLSCICGHLNVCTSPYFLPNN